MESDIIFLYIIAVAALCFTLINSIRHETCNGELNVKNQKGKAQSRRKRLSQEIFVK